MTITSVSGHRPAPFQGPGRSTVFGARAMVATSHPAASLAAIEVLRAGGSAVDAGLAAAFLLTIAEPHMTGLGGDMFALYAPPGAGPADVVALNGSGRAPRGLDVDAVRRRHANAGAIDPRSADAVTTPCGVAGLCRLHADYGRLDLARLTAAAVAAAEEGLPVAPRVAFDWADAGRVLQGAAQRHYLSDGRAYRAGERFRAPEQARLLRRIGAEGARAFLEGEAAEDMVASLRAVGGAHTLEDFAAVAPSYAKPVGRDYRGATMLTPPPNGQGAVALLMLDILAAFDLAALPPFGAERLHLEAEAARRAYSERDRLLADPDTPEGAAAVARLLDAGLGARLAATIDPARVTPPPAADTAEGHPHRDTIYLAVVDADGGALSLIVSIFHEFGSGLAAERSGVLLHNRGAGFALTEGHPNAIAPGKRPLHTLIPSMLFRDGKLDLVFGVMGGQYQACGQARLITNLLDYDMELQDAIDAPRSFAVPGGGLELEAATDAGVREALTGIGHALVAVGDPIGGAQAIRIDRARGLLIGGSDPRKDGCALGY